MFHGRPRTDNPSKPRATPVAARITIFDRNDVAIRDLPNVNLAINEKAKWFANLTRWALHNGYVVEVQRFGSCK